MDTNSKCDTHTTRESSTKVESCHDPTFVTMDSQESMGFVEVRVVDDGRDLPVKEEDRGRGVRRWWECLHL